MSYQTTCVTRPRFLTHALSSCCMVCRFAHSSGVYSRTYLSSLEMVSPCCKRSILGKTFCSSRVWFASTQCACPQYCELKAKRGKERTESSKSGIMSERKKRRNFLVYRLRQMDVDDKICEQIGPGVLEKIYPTEVIEQCVQGSDQWTATKRRVRQSTALGLVLFVILLALWSQLNQRQVWQKLVGGLSKLHPENLFCKMSSSALTVRRGELGSQVMKALMETCCRPIARREQTPEAFFGRYRLMAIDGTLFNVADVQANEQAFGRSSNQFGKGAYPQVRCVLLAQCGAHAVVGMQI